MSHHTAWIGSGIIICLIQAQIFASMTCHSCPYVNAVCSPPGAGRHLCVCLSVGLYFAYVRLSVRLSISGSHCYDLILFHAKEGHHPWPRWGMALRNVNQKLHKANLDPNVFQWINKNTLLCIARPLNGLWTYFCGFILKAYVQVT